MVAKIEGKVSYPIAAKTRGPGPAYYVPPSVGFADHIVTKTRLPAYSFGVKIDASQYNTLGPGPAAYTIVKNLTRKGPNGIPKYSMAYRLAMLKAFGTPGPGTYAPEQHAYPRSARPPAWTVGGRAKDSSANNFPSPAEYTLPSSLGPKVPHATGAPAHSMGIRTVQNDFTTDHARTPGPAAYSATPLATYRTRPPAYGLQSRQPLLYGNNMPGPAAYYPPLGITQTSPPKYSLGIKHSPWKAEVRVNPKDDQVWAEVSKAMATGSKSKSAMDSTGSRGGNAEGGASNSSGRNVVRQNWPKKDFINSVDRSCKTALT